MISPLNRVILSLDHMNVSVLELSVLGAGVIGASVSDGLRKGVSGKEVGQAVVVGETAGRRETSAVGDGRQPVGQVGAGVSELTG